MKSLGLNAAAVGNLDLSQFPHHKGGAMTTLTLLGYTLKTAEHVKVLPTSWPQSAEPATVMVHTDQQQLQRLLGVEPGELGGAWGSW